MGHYCTNFCAHVGLILAVAVRYKKDTGIGTMIAMMLPYSIMFLLGWASLFFLWVFAFDMPVGINTPTYYTP